MAILQNDSVNKKRIKMKKIIILILGLSIVFFVYVFVCYCIKLKGELEEKRIRANCGINFSRLAKLSSSDHYKKNKKISEIIKSKNKVFIPISNARFEDQLIIHHDLINVDISTPVLLVSDKSSIHKDGSRHVLMSDGNVYFLTPENFKKLKNRKYCE